MKGGFIFLSTASVLAYEVTDFKILEPYKKECATLQCLQALKDMSWRSIQNCRASSAANCDYVGTFTYDGDLVTDLVFYEWEDALIVSGAPPILGYRALHGYYVRSAVALHLNFEQLENVAGSEVADVRRCIYILSGLPANAQVKQSFTLEPERSCDMNGLPVKYQISPDLHVASLLANDSMSHQSEVSPNSLLWLGDRLSLLIEPLGDYFVTNITLHGDIQFKMKYISDF